MDNRPQALAVGQLGKLIRSSASGEDCLTAAKDALSASDAVNLARKIANIPSGEVPAMIRQMLHNRELFKTVGALDDLLTEQPEHRMMVSRALNKLGLWHGG